MNPNFTDPDNNDYTLASGSPCIDSGENEDVPEDVELDLNGDPRFVDDPTAPDNGNGDPPLVDMGAFEFQPVAQPIIEVNPTELVFDDIYVGESDTASFTISNNGTADLLLFDISCTLPDIFQISWGEPDSVIVPGASHDYTVVFIPAEIQEYMDEITIINNAAAATITLEGEGLDVSVNGDPSLIPKEFVLYPSYPNPFNLTATLSYGLPSSAEISLSVFDLEGRQVALLEEGFRPAGVHTVKFNASGLASGMYFVRFSAKEHLFVQKIILMK